MRLDLVDLKEDKRPKRKGWAPGDYFCRCGACNEQFIGDKRATTCADCAYAPSNDAVAIAGECVAHAIADVFDVNKRMVAMFATARKIDDLVAAEREKTAGLMSADLGAIGRITTEFMKATSAKDAEIERLKRREQELLEANNRYLAVARAGRRHLSEALNCPLDELPDDTRIN
jgi:hypothetical protein